MIKAANVAGFAVLHKSISVATALLLLIMQVAPGYAQVTLTPVDENYSTQSTKPADSTEAPVPTVQAPVDASSEFLNQELTLTPVTASEDRSNDNYYTEAYETAGEGIHEL